MTTENLGEFLNDRVLATRQVHHVAYPIDSDSPGVGVMIDCPADAMTCVILPTFVKGLLHLELHFFADGERTDPDVSHPSNGCIELMLEKPSTI